jgi:ABC-type phosphate/phosphonate transport system permease subunit
MTDVDRVLRDLSSIVRSETGPAINVRARVIQTVATQSRCAPLDVLPIAFTGVAVAIAAAVVIVFLHAWQTMFEPWVAYLP